MNVSQCSCGGMLTHLQPAHGHHSYPTRSGSLTYSQHMVIKGIPLELVHSPTASTWSSKGSHWKWFTHLQPAHGTVIKGIPLGVVHSPTASTWSSKGSHWKWFTHLQPAHGHRRDPTGGSSLTYSQHMVIKGIPLRVVQSPTASIWSS